MERKAIAIERKAIAIESEAIKAIAIENNREKSNKHR